MVYVSIKKYLKLLPSCKSVHPLHRSYLNFIHFWGHYSCEYHTQVTISKIGVDKLPIPVHKLVNSNYILYL